jgi:hypothetical protein
VESLESQNQASHSFHEPLGNLAQNRRDSHIPTALTAVLLTNHNKPPAGGLSPPARAPLRAASVVPFFSAAVVYFYSALDTVHMIRKGQVRWLPKGDVSGQIQFIRDTLGLKS